MDKKKMNKVAKNIDEYISNYPVEIQELLNQVRDTIKKSAPNATEKISWGMATFTYFGNLVHFAGETKHIGFHPSPSAIERFKDELIEYSCSKGTIRLPYDKPIPLDMIAKIVVFRVTEQEKLNQDKMDMKREKEF